MTFGVEEAMGDLARMGELKRSLYIWAALSFIYPMQWTV